MPFAAIEGQDRAIAYLKQTVTQNRLAHTMLFSGPDGVGKKSTALALAQAVNCQSPIEGDGCGTCLSCKKISEANHPDVRVIAADGQTIKIDQIRDQVQHQVLLKPMEGKVKVYIIDAAETMTIEASNSLLKILEEPPASMLIILITAQPFVLLDTIRSRCQDVRFNPIDINKLTGWLEKQLGINAIEAKTLAMLSEGRPSEALRLAEPDAQSLRKTVIQVMQDNRSGEWAKLAEQLGELRGELPEVINFMLSWFRDILLINQQVSTTLLVNLDFKNELQEQAKQETGFSLVFKCQLLLDALNQLKRNINQQLLLEVLLMRLNRGLV